MLKFIQNLLVLMLSITQDKEVTLCFSKKPSPSKKFIYILVFNYGFGFTI